MVTSAFSAEYPKEVQGKWIALENNQKNACENPQIVVDKKERYDEIDAMCIPAKVAVKKISNSITNFVVAEICGREGFEWKQTTTFEPGALMLVTEKRNQNTVVLRLKSCK